MAAEQVQIIREVLPHGPYVIGGFCLGGLLAYEVARQLAAAGEIVDRLLIIDATLENRRLRWLRRGAELAGRKRGLSSGRQLYIFCRWHFLVARLERWARMPLREKASVLCRRLIGRWRRLTQGLQPAKPLTASTILGGGVRKSADSDWFDPRWDVPLVYLWSAGGYSPEPYAGAATVLLSRDLFHGSGERELANLRQHLKKLDVQELPGSHLACITEHVNELAETIARCLASPSA
jgi:thioesterase domain-containing protein